MSKNSALISEAAEALRLRDIFLFQCHMARPEPFPEDPASEIEQLGRHGVQMVRQEVQDDDDKVTEIVQFYVGLGLRLAGQAPEDTAEKNDPPVFLEIEANYLVEYEITDSGVSENALKAFAQYNAVHNIWPFWRQHIFDLRQRGGLPKIEVPLFSGVKF
ncbi:MAG: hypothetical protein ACPGJE_01460 [Wenzhouxiangellaceae bacterium]